MTPEAISSAYAESFNDADAPEPSSRRAFEAGYRAGLREAMRKVNSALCSPCSDAVRIGAIYAIADTIEREANRG